MTQSDTHEAPRASLPLALRMIDVLTRLDGWLGALCLALLTLLMIAGIVVRAFSQFISWLPRDLPMSWEYSSYLMAATFTFGAAMALRVGTHVRVRLLTSWLPARGVRLLEGVLAIAAAGFTAYFALALARFTASTYLIGETSVESDTPLWIPQAAITFGVILLCCQFIARAARCLLGLPLETEAFEGEGIPQEH
jgi:TRAP-type C4-dicarboxylate transport system permease small subunit